MLWIPAALAGSVQIQVNSAPGRRRRKFQRIASSVPSLPKLFDPKWPKKLILRFFGIGSGDAFLFKQSSARRCGLSNGDHDPRLTFVKGSDSRASPIAQETVETRQASLFFGAAAEHNDHTSSHSIFSGPSQSPPG